MICVQCGKSYPHAIPPLRCSCGMTTGNIESTASVEVPPSFYIRKQLCDGCKYRTPKGCALYIKPCTVKYLWHDQIPPPENCPQATKFDE